MVDLTCDSGPHRTIGCVPDSSLDTGVREVEMAVVTWLGGIPTGCQEGSSTISGHKALQGTMISDYHFFF